MTTVVRLNDFKRARKPVCFTRSELNRLLSLYSRRVIRGDWKDYAIDHGARMAAFSVFQNPAAGPVFTVVKYPAGSQGGGEYVLYAGRRRLKRGTSLGELLSAIEADLRLVSP